MEQAWKRRRTSRYQDVSSQRSKRGDDGDRIRVLANQVVASPRDPLLVRERKDRRVMGEPLRILHRRQLSLTTVEVTVELSSTVLVSVGIDAGGSTTEMTTLPPESVTSSDTPVSASSGPASSSSAPPGPETTPETSSPVPPPSSYAASSGDTASLPTATPTPIPEPAPSSISSIPPASTPTPVPTVDTSLPPSTSPLPPPPPSSAAPPAPSESPLEPPPTVNTTVPVVSSSFTGSPYSTVSLGLLGSNNTSSTASISSTLSTISSTLLKPRPSSSSIESSSSISSIISSSSETTESSTATTSIESSTEGVGLIATAAATGSAGGSTGAGSNAEGHGSSSPPPTGVVVGGVVGGVAGLAALLLLALIFLRWYKRRGGGVQRLHENASGSDVRQIGPADRTMSERSFIPAAAIGWLNRLKEKDYEAGPASATSPTQEQGFQKISGRKLPSAFSPGLGAEDVAVLRQGHGSGLSASTYSRDSEGRAIPTWHAGASGSAIEPLNLAESSRGERGLQAEKETLMPSPARTPVIHSGSSHAIDFAGGGPSALHRPITPVRGTLGRQGSDDGSKGSRFTEEV